MKHIKAVLLLLLYPVCVSGQVSILAEIENEIARINSSVLCKAYRVFDGGDIGHILIGDKDLLKQRYSNADTVYFDAEKKIRKIVFTSEYGQLMGSVSYYNNEGDKIFSMEYDVDQEISVSCKRYLKKGRTFLLVGKVVEESYPKVLTTYICYKDGKTVMPYTEKLSATYDFALDKKYDIDSLMIPVKTLYDSIKMADCMSVIFETPGLFDTTVVNSYDVNIRKGPGMKEQIIDTISQLGHPVVVLEKVIGDNDSSMEAYPWYKIKYNKYYWEKPDRVGYIYGKYLDPVEKKSN